MKKTLTSCSLILGGLLCVMALSAQTGSFAVATNQPNHSKATPLLFVENLNQWHPNVRYKTTFSGSTTLFLEENGFTYLLTHPEDIQKIHDLHKHYEDAQDGIDVRHHAYRVEFVGANENAPFRGLGKKEAYHNYLLGNDAEKWASHVPLFGKIEQQNLYPGINLETYSQRGQLKYDLIVAPQADAAKIKIAYSGADKLELKDGILNIHTSVNLIQEMAPIAFQEINDVRQYVDCQYVLEDDILSFHFPNGYDNNYELVIDPTVVAATLSGTVGSANFGHSATYDNARNIYTGGRSFGAGYPTTTGAFQLNYGGGGTDISISKYNDEGNNLIYATYIGGSGGDLPHSIIADFNQQLYVYGSSSSNNYPVTGNAFQSSNSGGNDIVVSILSQDGGSLVGSSYYGGSGSDGVNLSNANSNYGDDFRGEIILDGQANVYVVSSTSSADFPVTSNAFDQVYNATGNSFDSAQDAVVFKANSDLSVLFWASYLGGDEPDIGNGIRLDDSNNVYVTGTAGAANFPTTTGAVMEDWPGDEENAYITKISSTGDSILISTFFGSPNGSEHSYFMDIDEENQVHIFGQTTGTIDITPGTYFNIPGSSQFLAAFDEDLSEVVYSTVIGTDVGGGFNNYDFVPVAFMVDKCNGIYFSGYYAADGLPTTSNAIDQEGGTFYLGVLEPDATSLAFGTYYGAADHVDGGTSRFDKGGVVYQGVCSCSGSVMNTLPGAWATTQVEFCDVGVFKIDFEIETIIANGTVLPSTSGCVPFTVDFTYTGQNAVEWEWYFPDGTVDPAQNPTFTFTESGSFEIPLVVKNPNTCNFTDTFFVQIDVLDGESSLTEFQICSGEDLFLDATTSNATYFWNDGTTGATLVVNEPGTYWVDVSIEGCEKRDSFIVSSLSTVEISLPADTSVCDVASITLDVEDAGIASYSWQDGSNDPTFSATETGIYSVDVIDTLGCNNNAEVELTFGNTLPIDLGSDTTLCDGAITNLGVQLTPNVTFLWSDGSDGEQIPVSEPGIYWVELNNEGCLSRDSIQIDYFPELFPNAEGIDILCANDCNGQVVTVPSGGSGMGYQISWETGAIQDTVTNLCPNDYSVTITDSNGCTGEDQSTVGAPPPLAMSLTLQDVECSGDNDGAIEVSTATGGVPPYLYSIDNEPFSPVNGAAFLSGGTYEVVTQDANDCLVSQLAVIEEPEDFVIYAGDDIFIQLGERADLNGQITPWNDQLIEWLPNDSLSCENCPNPSLFPTATMQMNLLVTDTASGCFKTDSLFIFVEKPREVYFPNAFSPNGDGNNDFFTTFAGIGVEEVLELRIFSRWGNLIFEQTNFSPNVPSIGWDGLFQGETLNPNIYVFLAKVRFKDGVERSYQGDVMLVR